MIIGVVGAPNKGKSTFFSAATLVDAAIANYPFTTIEPNRGVALVRAPCPHLLLGKQCNPKVGSCVNGTRLIPIQFIDVAGLVPGAHEGKGRGREVLAVARNADLVLIMLDVFQPAILPKIKEELAGIGIRLDQLVVLPSIGISTAVTSIVGQNIGAKKLKRVEWTVNTALKLLFVVEIAGGAIVLAFSGPLLGLFTSDITVINLGIAYISIVALTYCFRAGMIVLASAFQGAGEMMKALVMMASFYGLAFLLAYALLQTNHDISMIWLAIAGGSIGSFAISYYMYTRKMWVPKHLKAV